MLIMLSPKAKGIIWKLFLIIPPHALILVWEIIGVGRVTASSLITIVLVEDWRISAGTI